MEFGVFDHLDHGNIPLEAYYESRLRIVEMYDRGGFYGYHVAEHHATPLGMAPSPSVFLAAVAQRTETLRFGPMVYALPLYHPLRLAWPVNIDHLHISIALADRQSNPSKQADQPGNEGSE